MASPRPPSRSGPPDDRFFTPSTTPVPPGSEVDTHPLADGAGPGNGRSCSSTRPRKPQSPKDSQTSQSSSPTLQGSSFDPKEDDANSSASGSVVRRQKEEAREARSGSVDGVSEAGNPEIKEKYEHKLPTKERHPATDGTWSDWDQDSNTEGAGEVEDALILEEEDSEDMATWTGQPSVKGSTEMMRMVLLTFNAIGMTFTWGVEMTYCTPYLLSLGLTKGQTSMVWIAGPVSGLVVQPIIGVVADESKSRWGRRRPIIMIASAIVSCSLLMLGFTKEIVSWFISDIETAEFATIALAVLSLYCVDFSINAVMSCSRSLIVDTLPIHKQQSGAAWGSRMGSLGHIIGYALGAVDLVSLFGTTFGDTQFKQLTIIAALSMLATSFITCWAVTERVLVSTGPKRHQGRFKVFRQIWSTLLTLPPRIRGICWVVFWTWIGWYPFHVYSSTWVGETYFRFDVTDEARATKDVLGDMGRIGSTALTVYSIVNFAAAWLLPPLVRAPDDGQFTRRPPASIARLVDRIQRHKPNLLTVWFCGHLLFSTAMFLTPFAASFRFATFLVSLCGLPWTVVTWGPTTFLGVEVNKLSGAQLPYRRLSDEGRAPSSIELARVDTLTLAQHGDEDEEDEEERAGANGLLGTGRGETGTGTTGELSGVYFGILNIYTTIPQFVSTFISTIVFAVLEPGKSPELATDAHPSEHHGTDGPNAIAVCMFIGAISALGAAYATRRLKAL